MADQYVGVYLPEHRGEPAALFKDASHARMFRGLLDNANDVVTAPASGWHKRDDLEEQWHGTPAPAKVEPGSNADPDAVLRGQIRSRLEREERERELEKEIKAEMAAERRGDKPDEREGAKPGQQAPERPAGSTAREVRG